MKPALTIGILGGMSWESTALYYARINQRFTQRLGGVHSAPILIDSLDFAEVRALQLTNDWDEAGRLLARHAGKLQDAGAGLLAMAVNTMHRVAPAVTDAISIPFIDIRDAALKSLQSGQRRRPLLLGGSVVLEKYGFYVEYLRKHGIAPVLPDPAEQKALDHIIFEEFPRQIFSDQARLACRKIIERTAQKNGIDAIVLACTELPILLQPEVISDGEGLWLLSDDVRIPVVDTVEAHVTEIVEHSLRVRDAVDD